MKNQKKEGFPSSFIFEELKPYQGLHHHFENKVSQPVPKSEPFLQQLGEIKSPS